jgi:phosphate transport system substrate-binding protein
MKLFRTSITLSILVFLFSCKDTSTESNSREQTKIIRIKGSDTEYLMVKDLADAYTKEHPDVRIEVEGGGSNKGIAALSEDKIDICNSSREIDPQEIAEITKGKSKAVPIIFAVDALAIITNYKVGVDSMSVQQLAMLFSGKIRNWKELGGDDLPVILYGRDKASGTRNYFYHKILSGTSAGPITECSSNEAILKAVIAQPGAVGYVGTGFLFDSNGKPNGSIWAMPIYLENHAAVSPYQSAAVKKGDYILTRPLYQYVNGVPGELIQDFILSELTKRGQDIVMQHGFFPINDYQSQINRLKGLSD